MACLISGEYRIETALEYNPIPFNIPIYTFRLTLPNKRFELVQGTSIWEGVADALSKGIISKAVAEGFRHERSE